jgi:hypothetical protein
MPYSDPIPRAELHQLLEEFVRTALATPDLDPRESLTLCRDILLPAALRHTLAGDPRTEGVIALAQDALELTSYCEGISLPPRHFSEI